MGILPNQGYYIRRVKRFEGPEKKLYFSADVLLIRGTAYPGVLLIGSTVITKSLETSILRPFKHKHDLVQGYTNNSESFSLLSQKQFLELTKFWYRFLLNT